MPFGTDGQEFAEAVPVRDFFILITTGETQFVRQWRVQRNVIEHPDVLPWRRDLGFPAIAVPLRIDPMPRPVGFDPRADIGGVTQAKAHGPRLAGFEPDVHRDHIVPGGGRCRIHPHALEITARLQGLVEFGNQLGVIRRACLERHHALQQVFVEGRIAFETDLAQGVTRTTVIDQLDIGHAGSRVHRQCRTGKTPAEKAIARGLVLDQPLGIFIMAMVEHRTGFQRMVIGHTKGFERGGRAVDADGDVAQMHRFAGVDVQYQAWRLAALHVAVDVRLVITQGLGGLARLFLGAPTEAQQGFFVTIAETADIALYIGFQFIVGRFDPHIQFTLGQCRAAGNQHQHATGNSSWKLHRRGCYHEHA